LGDGAGQLRGGLGHLGETLSHVLSRSDVAVNSVQVPQRRSEVLLRDRGLGLGGPLYGTCGCYGADSHVHVGGQADVVEVFLRGQAGVSAGRRTAGAGEGLIRRLEAGCLCRCKCLITGGLDLLTGLLDLDGERTQRVRQLRVAQLLREIRLLSERVGKVPSQPLGVEGAT
jgi:hypothetical protein